jgi:hypothetical protein
MINRQAVLEYLTNNPNYSIWQMRLHFLQAASSQQQCKSAMSIGSIANQLNYILSDLEATGAIPPQTKVVRFNRDLLGDVDRTKTNS